MNLAKSAWGLLKETFSDWSEDKAPRLGAALAYYTPFSIAPLLLIAIAIAAMVFGDEAARGQIVGQIGGLVGDEGARALIYKFLPDAKVGWGDGWIGAVATAFLFVVGKFAIGLYLGHASIGSAYGGAGSLVVVLVWVYYSAQIFLFGAELTQVYATRHGAPVEPARDAIKITESDRRQQGMARSA